MSWPIEHAGATGKLQSRNSLIQRIFVSSFRFHPRDARLRLFVCKCCVNEFRERKWEKKYRVNVTLGIINRIPASTRLNSRVETLFIIRSTFPWELGRDSFDVTFMPCLSSLIASQDIVHQPTSILYFVTCVRSQAVADLFRYKEAISFVHLPRD